MRIERVIFRGLRALRQRDDRLGEPGQVWPALCLRGLNGSGKTTYLEAVAELWQWFRRCASERRYSRPGTPLLASAELAAMLLTDLPGPRPRMWVAWGRPSGMTALYGQPDLPLIYDDGPGGEVHWDGSLLSWWDQAFAQAESGGPGAPNVVYLGAESKYIRVLKKEELLAPRPTPVYVPVARYLPEARGASHLEGLIRTLFLARRTQWDILRGLVADLMPGLTLSETFDQTAQRPLFQLSSGEMLTLDLLSAGQRSLLINLCTVLRWLAPGGVVLLDEPELHLHLSLMRASLALTEELVCQNHSGQLLVASHAPEVWDHFRGFGRILDLEGPR